MQLSPTDEAQIAAVMAYATSRPDTARHMAERLTGRLGPPGDNPNNACVVTVDDRRYQCVYSLEEQPEPIGWCRHVSFSCADTGKQMRLENVNALVWRFGLRARLKSVENSDTARRGVTSWVEVHNGLKIINLLEPVDAPSRPEEPIPSVQALPGVRGVFITHDPQGRP